MQIKEEGHIINNLRLLITEISLRVKQTNISDKLYNDINVEQPHKMGVVAV